MAILIKIVVFFIVVIAIEGIVEDLKRCPRDSETH